MTGDQVVGGLIIGSFTGAFSVFLIMLAKSMGVSLDSGAVIGGVMCVLLIWLVTLVTITVDKTK